MSYSPSERQPSETPNNTPKLELPRGDVLGAFYQAFDLYRQAPLTDPYDRILRLRSITEYEAFILSNGTTNPRVDGVMRFLARTIASGTLGNNERKYRIILGDIALSSKTLFPQGETPDNSAEMRRHFQNETYWIDRLSQESGRLTPEEKQQMAEQFVLYRQELDLSPITPQIPPPPLSTPRQSIPPTPPPVTLPPSPGESSVSSLFALPLLFNPQQSQGPLPSPSFSSQNPPPPPPLTPLPASNSSEMIRPYGQKTPPPPPPPLFKETDTTSERDVEFLSMLKEFSQRPELEERKVYEQSLDNALQILERESGLVELEDLPTLVVPDIHARREFLYAALNSRIRSGIYQGEKVYDLLADGKLNVVCLGDGMHSERKELWQTSAYDIQPTRNGVAVRRDGNNPVLTEYGKALLKRNQLLLKITQRTDLGNLSDEQLNILFFAHEDPQAVAFKHELADAINNERDYYVIKREVIRSFGVMKMVMDLKTHFPDRFHYIRGNHDDIAEKIGRHMKYEIAQSTLIKNWVQDNFGYNFLEKWAEFDAALPLAVRGRQLIATHSLPAEALSETSIIHKKNPRVIRALTTTNNSEVLTTEQKEVVSRTREQLRAADGVPWVVGHRPVKEAEHEGRYRELIPKELFQINNATQYMVGYFPDSQGTFKAMFNPDSDIYPV